MEKKLVTGDAVDRLFHKLAMVPGKGGAALQIIPSDDGSVTISAVGRTKLFSVRTDDRQVAILKGNLDGTDARSYKIDLEHGFTYVKKLNDPNSAIIVTTTSDLEIKDLLERAAEMSKASLSPTP